MAGDRDRSAENVAVESGKIVADERFRGVPDVSNNCPHILYYM